MIYRTKSGRELTEDDIEKLVTEAERGYEEMIERDEEAEFIGVKRYRRPIPGGYELTTVEHYRYRENAE